MSMISMVTISLACTVCTFTGASDEVLLGLVALNLGNVARILIFK